MFIILVTTSIMDVMDIMDNLVNIVNHVKHESHVNHVKLFTLLEPITLIALARPLDLLYRTPLVGSVWLLLGAAM